MSGTMARRALGLTHPDFAKIAENYNAMLRAMGRGNEEIKIEIGAKKPKKTIADRNPSD